MAGKPRRPSAKSKPKGKVRARRKAAAKKRATKKPVKRIRSKAYEDNHREKEAARRRKLSAGVKEVGLPPAVVDPARKARGRKSLLDFCREYFPNRFRLSFAEPHFTAIDRMERCTDQGGKFACGMPRGMGKTTLAECAVLRAVLYGLRRFVMLICATAPLAKRRLKQLLRELETNDLLLADFPEVCHFIRKLERVHQRAKGQTCNGVPTRMELSAESIILPVFAGSPASGAILQVAGMEGAIRGANIAAPDGTPLRPDMALLDDVQTRESARSPLQTNERESIILDDVVGLAGGDVEIAVVMLATVIAPGDLSDRFLSPEIRPDWQGVRTRMLEKWPERMDLWDEYAEVQRESFRSGNGGRRSRQFYLDHREEMDRGASVSWPDRKKPSEASGLQSAMNLYYANPRGFRAEYQNDPDPVGGVSTAKQLSPVYVVKCLSGLARFEVPRESSRLVAFVDAGGGRGRGLWYGVTAFDNAFGGAVVDYGAFPRQQRSFFSATDMRPGLAELYPQLSATERLYAGLAAMADEVLGRVYIRETTGEQIRVERCLIDCGWEAATIYKFIRESKHAGILLPSKGVGRTTTSRGVSEWKPRPGERSGYHWRLTISETGRGRMVQFDPDVWKTAIYERFTTAPGGRGRLTLFAREAQPGRAVDHEMIAQHCAAESAEPATLRGATFDKWTVPPHNPDNHLFDVLVGCHLAASVQGLVWSPSGQAEVKPAFSGAAKSFSEIQRQNRQQREAG